MNKALKTLYLYNGIFVFASHLFGPLYAIYVAEIDNNILSVSISWSAFMFSTVFFTFLVSRYGDSVKEKEYLLVAGFIVRAVVWLLYIFVGNIWFLLFTQILLGLGESLGTPAFNVIFAEHLDQGKHVAEYANWKIINHLVGATAVILGGFIVKYLGFNWLFIGMSLLALVSTVGIILKPRKLL